MVDLLASLVDASMVTVGATEGTVRYSLLETLRGYGSEHLGDCGEADRSACDTLATTLRSPIRQTAGCVVRTRRVGHDLSIGSWTIFAQPIDG